MPQGRYWVDGPRLVLESENSVEEGAVFVIGTEEQKSGQRLFISVTEEKAVGSNNRDFECTLRATMAQARELRDWLVANIPNE